MELGSDIEPGSTPSRAGSGISGAYSASGAISATVGSFHMALV